MFQASTHFDIGREEKKSAYESNQRLYKFVTQEIFHLISPLSSFSFNLSNRYCKSKMLFNVKSQRKKGITFTFFFYFVSVQKRDFKKKSGRVYTPVRYCETAENKTNVYISGNFTSRGIFKSVRCRVTMLRILPHEQKATATGKVIAIFRTQRAFANTCGF